MGDVSLSIKEQGAGGGNISIALSATGAELKKRLAEQTKIAPETMKLLAAGKFLKDEQTLADQGVKATTKQQAAVAAKVQADEAAIHKLNTTVAVAEELASRKEDEEDDSRYYFELTNQKGEKVDLPPADRKALVMGMALHEKGRKLLEENQWKAGLELLLQADNSFNHCAPQFLEAVDNHAFLHLDICWCYFKLKDLNYLKDADWRLTKAQTFLERSYGRDLGRLVAIKGGVCPEMIIFCRMLVLRGILAFHQGQTVAARTWFTQAAHRVTEFDISDAELSGLMGMGFSASESRIALRACHKDPSAAITYLLKKREEAERIRAEEKAKHQQKKFGKTVNGKLVDMAVYKSILDMGFDSRMIVAGLRQTNNDGPATIALLTQNPELLQEAIARELPYTEEKIQQCIFLGFTREQAIAALTLMRGDVQRAVEHLLQVPPFKPAAAPPPAAAPLAVAAAEAAPSIDADTMSDDIPPPAAAPTAEELKQRAAEEEKRKKEEEEWRLKRDIEDELLDAVPRDAEEYFDLDVGELSRIIGEYSAQLK